MITREGGSLGLGFKKKKKEELVRVNFFAVLKLELPMVNKPLLRKAADQFTVDCSGIYKAGQQRMFMLFIFSML